MLPEIPGDKSSVYEDCLVHPVISNALKKDPPSNKGYLERVYVDIGAVVMPRVGPYAVR